MEPSSDKAEEKSARHDAMIAIRVTQPLHKKFSTLLARVNKKTFGKRVRADDILAIAISLITDEHIKTLQNNSLSNSDKLEMRFKQYTKRHGPLSKDEFLGLLLSGKIADSTDPNEQLSEVKIAQ